MTERTLTHEAQLERDDFDRKFDGGNCSCHISPPCSSCTHPGNPRNQEEDETAWVTETVTDVHKTGTELDISGAGTHESGSEVHKSPISEALEAIVSRVRHYGLCVAKASGMEAQPQDDAAADEALRNIEARILLALSNLAGSSCAECGKTHGEGWALYCVDCCMTIKSLVSPTMPDDLREVVKALGVQQQLDADGITVGVSREALDRAVNMLARFAALEPVAKVVSSGPEANLPLLEWLSADHSLRTPIGSMLYAGGAPEAFPTEPGRLLGQSCWEALNMADEAHPNDDIGLRCRLVADRLKFALAAAALRPTTASPVASPEGDTLEDNVRYLLDKCPYTVRDHSGDRTGSRAKEDLSGSLAITFLGMQRRLHLYTQTPAQPLADSISTIDPTQRGNVPGRPS